MNKNNGDENDENSVLASAIKSYRYYTRKAVMHNAAYQDPDEYDGRNSDSVWEAEFNAKWLNNDNNNENEKGTDVLRNRKKSDAMTTDATMSMSC